MKPSSIAWRIEYRWNGSYLPDVAPLPEQLERAALRGGGEGEERHVRLPPAGVDLLGEEVLHRIGHLVDQRDLGRFGRREQRRLGGGGDDEPPPSTFFISLAESPVWEEWASSMITA